MPLLYIPSMTFAGMMLLRVAHGITWGMVSASSQTAAVDSMPAGRRGEGIGIFGLSMAFAMAFSPAVGMWVIGTFSYTSLFISEAIIGFLGLGLALKATYRPAPAVRPAFRLRTLLEPASLPVSCLAFVLCLSFGASINWISVYALDIENGSTGLFFMCMATGTGITRIVTGKIYDRRGPLGVSAWGFAMLAASMFLLAGKPGLLNLYLGGLLVGCGTGVFMPVSLAIINSLVPADRRGAANSTYFTMFDCGVGVGIIIAGALMPHIGLQGAFAVFGFCALAGAAYFYLYAWPYSRKLQQIKKY